MDINPTVLDIAAQLAEQDFQREQEKQKKVEELTTKHYKQFTIKKSKSVVHSSIKINNQ